MAMRELPLHCAEVAGRSEQSVQQDKRVAAPCLYRTQDHERRSGQAAKPTPPMMSAEPSSRSAVNGSPRKMLARTRLIAGVVRNPTDETTVGRVAVACITHKVPNGPAIRPM